MYKQKTKKQNQHGFGFLKQCLYVRIIENMNNEFKIIKMKIEELNGMNGLQLVVSYEDLKRVCADLFNDERIRQEKMKENENNGMVSAKQAMDILGVKSETLWRWHNSGYLCHLKVGNRNYYRRSDLEEIMAKRM